MAVSDQCSSENEPSTTVKKDIAMQKKLEYVRIVKILCVSLPLVVRKKSTYCPTRESPNPTKNFSAEFVSTNSE